MLFQMPILLRQVFDPLLAWARDTLGAELAVDDSIFGANQPSEAIQTLRQHLEGVLRHYWNPAMCCCSNSLLFWAAIDGVCTPVARRQITHGVAPGKRACASETPICMCWPHASSLVLTRPH